LKTSIDRINLIFVFQKTIDEQGRQISFIFEDSPNLEKNIEITSPSTYKSTSAEVSRTNVSKTCLASISPGSSAIAIHDFGESDHFFVTIPISH
jgi:hypothetical protein